MPDNLPQHPDFGYFTERPSIIVDCDDGDEAAPVYPTRAETVTRVHAGDFETAEIARLRAELEDWKQTRVDDCNFLWAILYPDDPGGWEYRTQPHAHVRQEIETLRKQLEAARHAYAAAYQALVTDNPWRMAEVRDRLREIGAALGVA